MAKETFGTVREGAHPPQHLSTSIAFWYREIIYAAADISRSRPLPVRNGRNLLLHLAVRQNDKQQIEKIHVRFGITWTRQTKMKIYD